MNRQQRRQMKKRAQGTTPPAHDGLNHLLIQAEQYKNTGQLAEAEGAYRAFLAARSNVPEIFCNLGIVLANQGKLDAAVDSFRQAVALKPDFVQAHYSLGYLFEQQHRLEEAVNAYECAFANQPDFMDAYYRLTNILMQNGHYERLKNHYERMLAMKPNHVMTHNNLGIVFYRLGEMERAEAHYTKALALDARFPEAHANYGTLLVSRGRLDDAMRHFEQALTFKPEHASTHYSLSLLKTFGKEDKELVALQGLIARNDVPEPDKVYLHFALGKALKDTGDHAGAFDHWLKGGGLKRRQVPYDEAQSMRHFQAVIDTFTPELVAQHSSGDATTAPIFIVGMPRSGSTLVEQILASHPQVQGGGELLAMVHASGAILDTKGAKIPYPAYIPLFTNDALAAMRKTYLDALPPLPEGKTRITDKRLSNFLLIGLIHLLFPQAKIVHTVRNPMDTCVSCFSTLFFTEQEYAYDLGELGRYYRQYDHLMQHWHTILPEGRILDFSYEALVDDFDTQARKLVEYCGLDWDERCLNFHQNKRSVATASNVQVRKPIYGSSVKRWQKYEPHLGPLLAELGELAG